MSGPSDALHGQNMLPGKMKDKFFLGLDASFMSQGAYLGKWAHVPTQAIVSTCSPIPNTDQVFMFAKGWD